MRTICALLCLTLATPVWAQNNEPGFFDRLFGSDEASSDDEQGSLLEQLIEDQLSGVGRVVQITGFRGALSGAATLDSLTIADDAGVWITLNEAELDWNRAALFSGRIEVAKLTAGEILLPRIPASDDTEAPKPEASGFQLPDLPVSIQIDEISADKVALGSSVLGEEVELSTDGALSLIGGEGTATLEILRLDQPGAAMLDVAYSNSTGVLALDLSLQEEAGGLLSTLAGLPGAPSVDFTIAGTAPVGNYAADIRLATDGADRLTGQIQTFTVDDTLGVTADISGDIAPLFAPDYRPFFGNNVGLNVSAFRTEGGGTVLKDLSLRARAIALNGDAILGASGMPRRFNLNGEISDALGEPVLLPLAGEETRVNKVTLDLAFDAYESENWVGTFDIDQFRQGPITAESAQLRVLGQIVPDTSNKVTAEVTYQIGALDLGDPSLRAAVGDNISGEAAIDWQGGRDLRLSRLTLEGEAYGLEGQAVVSTQDDSPFVEGEAALRTDRLAVFSGLAGRALGGAANLDLVFAGAPLLGTFDVTAKGSGQDITLSEPRADAVLSGPAKLDLRAIRNEGGVGIFLNTVETDQANLTGRATLTSGSSTMSLAGRLEDAALILEGLQGPVMLEVTGKEDEARDWDVAARIDGEVLNVVTTGRLLNLYDTPRADGSIEIQATDLSSLSELAGRPLGGAASMAATGSVAFDLSTFSLDGTLAGSDLRTGITEVDRLLTGEAKIAVVASGADGRITLSRMAVDTDALTARALGTLGADGSALDIAARLFDVSPFVAGLSGEVSVTGKVEDTGAGALRVDVTGTGPGGIRAEISGTAADNFSRADLVITGRAPLQVANSFIAPTTLSGPLSFDLRLIGPPELSSLSGQLISRDTRLVVPDTGVALNGIAITADLASGRANLDVSGAIEGGGQVAVRGPVTLSAPYSADLAVTLTNARISDPRLFETRLGGGLRVTGPLEGDARISGNLALGPTEIRIPSTGLGGAGAIPEIVHLNEPPPVRGTRRRAGLLETVQNKGQSTGGPVYPLDITITATNQLFVRGRGLDSEFGGALSLGGTSRNVVPSGGFNLIRGRLDILGQRLALDEARITMEGSFIPRLFLIATTDVDDTSVSVAISGPADAPDIAFTSAPELPQEEVLARLIFGRGLENLSALQAARLALAVRTLAGRGGEGIVSRLRNNTGLADLDVTTTDDGNAALRAGAYLNDNIYTDVTVDSEGETQLNLNLDFTESLTVKGGFGSEGETSIGIFFERDY
jgi:translocation and assembly module TamB